MSKAIDPLHDPTDEQVIVLTRRWVEHAVIGLNLCPFANAVLRKNQIAFQVSHARDADTLLQNLMDSIEWLLATPAEATDTLLLIHPWVLSDFFEFNDLIGDIETLLEDSGLEGVLQIASFHPDYQFAGVATDDVTNHTNRSPFPILHLLREDSLDKAIGAMPHTDDIIERNLDTMRQLGTDGWQTLQARIRKDTA